MKHSSLKPYGISALLLSALLAILLCGCQKGEPAAAVSPFSDVTWEYSTEDIRAYENTEPTTYDSVYGGLCYTYPKSYDTFEGTVKYMFDGEEKLMCIAWTCSSEEEQELYDFYAQIEAAVNAKTDGNPAVTDKISNAGHVWYREDGNIILSLMLTSDLKALQYAYLHPDVSSPPKE